MKKRLKQMIKKHVKIVKNMYPILYIEVEEDGDEIFICIDSQDISNEKRYEDLMNDFIEEYDSKGYYDVYWGVNSTLTCDNLSLLEDFEQMPMKEKIRTIA